MEVQKPKVPVAIAVAMADAAAAKARERSPVKVNRANDHLANLRRQVNDARKIARPKDWWANKRDDLLSFAKGIHSANFGDLVERWKDCQARLVKVGDQSPPDRRAVYGDALASIEAEWLRRSALLYSKDAYFDWPTTNTRPGAG